MLDAASFCDGFQGLQCRRAKHSWYTASLTLLNLATPPYPAGFTGRLQSRSTCSQSIWERNERLSGLRQSWILRERGNFAQVKSKHEYRVRSAASPTSEFPFRAQELHFGFQGEIENLARFSAIKALRHFQQRQFSKILPVSRAPHRNIHEFLLDLFGDEHGAHKNPRPAGRDFERLAFAIGGKPCAGRN